MRRFAGRDNITTFPRFPPPPCAALERPTRCTLTSLPNASHMRLAWGACTVMRLLTSPGRTPPAAPDTRPVTSGEYTPAHRFFPSVFFFGPVVVFTCTSLSKRTASPGRTAPPRAATETQRNETHPKMRAALLSKALGRPFVSLECWHIIHYRPAIASPVQGIVGCVGLVGCNRLALERARNDGALHVPAPGALLLPCRLRAGSAPCL